MRLYSDRGRPSLIISSLHIIELIAPHQYYQPPTPEPHYDRRPDGLRRDPRARLYTNKIMLFRVREAL